MFDPDLTHLRSLLAELAPQGRPALLPALHAAQRLYGWLPEPVAAEVGRALGVPLADVHGVIDFYAMFSRQPMGRSVVRVCSAPICALAGGDAVANALCRYLKVEPDEVSADGEFTIEHAPCLGLCDHAPALLVGEVTLGHAEPDQTAGICARSGQRAVSFVGGDIRSLRHRREPPAPPRRPNGGLGWRGKGVRDRSAADEGPSQLARLRAQLRHGPVLVRGDSGVWPRRQGRHVTQPHSGPRGDRFGDGTVDRGLVSRDLRSVLRVTALARPGRGLTDPRTRGDFRDFRDQ